MKFSRQQHFETLLAELTSGSLKALARCISLVENEIDGFEELLMRLSPVQDIPVIGITGPPGSGKSTLLNGIAGHIAHQNKKVAIIAVDPTSPFHHGSLLGDRLRLSALFNHPGVYIRSLAARGALGGLSSKTFEVVDIIRSAGFDYIFIETVGVGQTEVEIASLADTTVLVLVPESGDDIQALKAGIMEIADIFVVNKSDRPGAVELANTIRRNMHTHQKYSWYPPVIQTIGIHNEGVQQLLTSIEDHKRAVSPSLRLPLLLEKCLQVIRNKKMRSVNRLLLEKELEKAVKTEGFNLYKFAEKYGSENDAGNYR
jgi:LAO/AO transport system kinase